MFAVAVDISRSSARPLDLSTRSDVVQLMSSCPACPSCSMEKVRRDCRRPKADSLAGGQKTGQPEKLRTRRAGLLQSFFCFGSLHAAVLSVRTRGTLVDVSYPRLGAEKSKCSPGRSPGRFVWSQGTPERGTRQSCASLVGSPHLSSVRGKYPSNAVSRKRGPRQCSARRTWGQQRGGAWHTTHRHENMMRTSPK